MHNVITCDFVFVLSLQHFPATEGYRHTETNSYDVSRSQTDDCTVYQFIQDDVLYKFIDTPGLNDTRYYEQDEKNLTKILAKAKDTHDLVGVLLIINGTQGRMTPAMESIVLSLRGNIPDNVMQNFLVILSKCDKDRTSFQRSTLATIAPNIQKESIFYMDNSAFVAKPRDPQTTRNERERARLENERKKLESDWKKSLKTCRKVVNLISTLSYLPVNEFKEVSDHRFRIRALLHAVKLEMKKYQDVLEQLEVLQLRVKDLDENEAKFKNYTRQEITKVKIKHKTPYHNTVCSQCDFVCHQRCGLNEVPDKGSNHFMHCAAIDGAGNCRQCPRKCSHYEHYHAKHIFSEVEQPVETILYDMKEQYDDIVKERENVILQINNYRNSIDSLGTTQKTIVDNLNFTCNRLKQLCTGFNFADELRVFYNQLTQLAKKQTTQAAQIATTATLNLVQRMIDFHSQLNGSVHDAHLMRPDLDNHEDSDSDDDDDDYTPASRTTTTRTKFPSKTRATAPVVVPEDNDSDSEDAWENLSLNICPVRPKPATQAAARATSPRSPTSPGVPRFSEEPQPCRDCGRHFVLSKSEYDFYVVEKQGMPPKRCRQCRNKK